MCKCLSDSALVSTSAVASFRAALNKCAAFSQFECVHSCLAQDVLYAISSSDIVDMLQGAAEGGSGVTLDRKAYEASVAYWDQHAGIISGTKPSGE